MTDNTSYDVATIFICPCCQNLYTTTLTNQTKLCRFTCGKCGAIMEHHK